MLLIIKCTNAPVEIRNYRYWSCRSSPSNFIVCLLRQIEPGHFGELDGVSGLNASTSICSFPLNTLNWAIRNHSSGSLSFSVLLSKHPLAVSILQVLSCYFALSFVVCSSCHVRLMGLWIFCYWHCFLLFVCIVAGIIYLEMMIYWELFMTDVCCGSPIRIKKEILFYMR